MGLLTRVKGFEWAGPPQGFIDGRTQSGEVVTADSAMAVGVIFRCVALLGGTVAGMPLITYRASEDRLDRATDHPIYRLLHDSPTPGMTSFIWREMAMGHLLLWGNHYAEMIWDQYNQLVGIKPLPPHRVTPRTVNGKHVYDYRQPDGGVVRLTSREMLHIPGLGYDGFVGYSVLTLMREDVGLYRAAQSFGANTFRNNARPAVILQHPKALPAAVQERLAAQMDRLRGSANAGKTIVLEDDMKFATLGMSPEDAQYMATRQFQTGELSRWFGIPPHMVGDVSGSTSWGTGIAEQSMGFLRFTADSWLNRWEAQLKLQVFEGWPELHAEFLREALLKAATLVRFQAYGQAIRDGWLSRAEVRARENLNPAEGLEEFVLPVNIAEITTDPNGAVTNVQMRGQPPEAKSVPDAPLIDERPTEMLALLKEMHARPSLTVEAPVIHNHLPTPDAPVVNVTTPAVNVTTPPVTVIAPPPPAMKARTVTKRVERDPITHEITTIVEESV